MRTLVRMVFGSHLYGTADVHSDRDFKGVYLPSFRQLALGQAPKSIKQSTGDDRMKNQAGDVDNEIYSLHYLVKMALQGETQAVDMLHADARHWLESSEPWRYLHQKRHAFYSRNMTALIGYARRQAAKYGIKGSRLEAAENVCAVLRRLPLGDRLYEQTDVLPIGEHRSWIDSDSPQGRHRRHYCCCGKRFHDTARIGHVLPVLENFVTEYGKRAHQARDNDGVDWKAISHAFRAGYQLRRILQDGGFEYPLPEAPFLCKVKRGACQYLEVAPQLENLIDECEALAAVSSLPEKIDAQPWEDWIVEVTAGLCKDPAC